MSDSGLTICIGDGCPEGDSDTYGESSTPHDTQAEAPQGETLSGSSQHAANADSAWRAITSSPDFCWVGNSVTGFDSIATLDNPVRYSPNVIAAGCELYRVNDLFQGIQGDAGQHVISGTSLGSGHVLITGGQDNVKANGLPMARHDSPCTINCNAAGVGGTPGYLATQQQSVDSSAGQSGDEGPSYNPGEEAGSVLRDKWEGAKAAAKTAWEALPITGDEVTTDAARGRVVQGTKDTIEAVDVLTGPSPLDLLDSGIGYVTGDVERAARYGEEWKRTGEAYGGIKDSMVNAWQEAEERNGFFGAVEMSAMVLVAELAGGKGTGVVRGAAGAARRTPETPDTPPPRTPDGEGTHVSRRSPVIRNGYTYSFDSHGRVNKVEGEIKLNRSQGRNQRAQLEAGGADRLPADQGGHYVGRRFDGPMDDFNHFAQNGNFNMGAYKSLENSWQRALESGASVRVEVIPSYIGNSQRPSSLTVRQWIDGRPQLPLEFGNNPGGRL
ncbi:DNA/RNA non-specific endonuclease [Vreelandella titanicae]|uniref:DNA/RNA non-specific endonuclease n=1 Tax=Vreelandella titanicae TaxID=664683 RepID=UPI0039BF5438